jgi:hypothetical protein
MILKEGITLRRLTLGQIEAKKTDKGNLVDQAVNLFRGKTKQEGWIMKRTRPRDADEIRALNYVARRSLRNALNEGTVRYDRERRVLLLAKYSRS